MDFFTSDQHFNHEGAMAFDNRPFASVGEMNAELIKRWNARVSDRDTVYILGDLMWSIGREESLAILNALNGHLVLVRGNHDGRWLHGDEVRNRFMRIEDYIDMRPRLSDGTRKYVSLSHYPIFFYNHAHHDGVMLYGHVHVSREYAEVERMRKELVARGVPCEMHNVFCGLYDWAPATLEEILAHEYDPSMTAYAFADSKHRPGGSGKTIDA